ncbi:hypothetical protein NL676_027484 [Syzygium grande]|nr:hypothetical protein NL676_027484 [Syzygium grande]
MVFAGPSSPASTDSDTESVGKAAFCPIFPGMVSAGPSSPASTDSGTETGGKEGKLVMKSGQNSDQLRRKAMRGLSASLLGFMYLENKKRKLDYNAKLSDFRLAKLGLAGGNTHVTTHLYVKSDVYGFRVVLLEMLTGLQALDLERPSSQQNLVEWARPLCCDKGKLRKIMYARLEGQYPLKAATQAAELILKCLEGDSKARPLMDEVLVALERIDNIRERKKEAKASTSSRPSSHQHHHNHH